VNYKISSKVAEVESSEVNVSNDNKTYRDRARDLVQKYHNYQSEREVKKDVALKDESLACSKNMSSISKNEKNSSSKSRKNIRSKNPEDQDIHKEEDQNTKTNKFRVNVTKKMEAAYKLTSNYESEDSTHSFVNVPCESECELDFNDCKSESSENNGDASVDYSKIAFDDGSNHGYGESGHEIDDYSERYYDDNYREKSPCFSDIDARDDPEMVNISPQYDQLSSTHFHFPEKNTRKNTNLKCIAREYDFVLNYTPFSSSFEYERQQFEIMWKNRNQSRQISTPNLTEQNQGLTYNYPSQVHRNLSNATSYLNTNKSKASSRHKDKTETYSSGTRKPTKIKNKPATVTEQCKTLTGSRKKQPRFIDSNSLVVSAHANYKASNITVTAFKEYPHGKPYVFNEALRRGRTDSVPQRERFAITSRHQDIRQTLYSDTSRTLKLVIHKPKVDIDSSEIHRLYCGIGLILQVHVEKEDPDYITAYVKFTKDEHKAVAMKSKNRKLAAMCKKLVVL
jgi:hypothetical protein